VHWVGQTIGAVVAESRDVARQAAAAISVTYDELPAIITIDVSSLLACCGSVLT